MGYLKHTTFIINHLTLNIVDWLKDKLRRVNWPYSSIVTYKHYLIAIKQADIYQNGQESVARIITNDGVKLFGPTDSIGSMCGKSTVKILRRLFDESRHRQAEDACIALFHNLVTRYWREFSVYPDSQIRTASLRPGDVFIDIGAFRGYVSLKAALKVGEAGHVISVEPVAQNCTFISMHRELNGLSNWDIFQGVASTKNSPSADIYITQNQMNSLLNSNIPTGAAKLSVKNYRIAEILTECIVQAQNKRIIISVTTNGDEMELVLSCLRIPDIRKLNYIQFIIPIIYTKDAIKKFRLQANEALDGLVYMENYPWLSISLSSY